MRMKVTALVVLALGITLPTLALADPIVLRMAGVAPEGTMWAREVKQLARDVEAGTNGAVTMKWYLGGIAGDELTAINRIQRGQLDGEAGGGFCERLAPSLRVLRLVGLVDRRDELRYIINKLRPRLEAEMARNGFVSLGFASFGAPILMTRTPVASMVDFQRTRLWVWSEDDVAQRSLTRLGVPVVAADVADAASLYADGKTDGFVSIPLGGLGFQWSAQARYFTELPIGILPGCLVVAQKSFDALPIEHQAAIRNAGAKMLVHFEETGRIQDAELLGGLFDRQGMKRVPVSPAFRDQFFDAARRVRESVAAEVSSRALLNEVLGWLADFRAEQETPRHRP
jgi:TRAP-type C4-dicarboxylate transport system substrate-binding protein